MVIETHVLASSHHSRHVKVGHFLQKQITLCVRERDRWYFLVLSMAFVGYW